MPGGAGRGRWSAPPNAPANPGGACPLAGHLITLRDGHRPPPRTSSRPSCKGCPRPAPAPGSLRLASPAGRGRLSGPCPVARDPRQPQVLTVLGSLEPVLARPGSSLACKAQVAGVQDQVPSPGAFGSVRAGRARAPSAALVGPAGPRRRPRADLFSRRPWFARWLGPVRPRQLLASWSLCAGSSTVLDRRRRRALLVLRPLHWTGRRGIYDRNVILWARRPYHESCQGRLRQRSRVC